jgi:general secretion pathway protein G
MLTACIIGILTGIAVPSYSSYRNKIDTAQAIADMNGIELSIEKFYAENNRYPNSLADIGKGNQKDPWGRSYHYLNMANDPHQNQCRKLGPVHPLNTDYDLYSSGKDGKSNKPINSGPSMDDIIRAFNGSYLGSALNII